MTDIAELPATLAASVMATVIVSVGLQDEGARVASRALLWIGATLFVAALLALALASTSDPAELRRWMQVPTALTTVAAPAVLGTRLTMAGSYELGFALLALA